MSIWLGGETGFSITYSHSSNSLEDTCLVHTSPGHEVFDQGVEVVHSSTETDLSLPFLPVCTSV